MGILGNRDWFLGNGGDRVRMRRDIVLQPEEVAEGTEQQDR